MYRCSNCGYQMEYPLDTCPGCKVLLSGVKCNGCGYTDSKEVFIRNNHYCPKCGSFVYVRDVQDRIKSDTSSRVDCKRCNAKILQQTYDKYNGLCARCAKAVQQEREYKSRAAGKKSTKKSKRAEALTELKKNAIKMALFLLLGSLMLGKFISLVINKQSHADAAEFMMVIIGVVSTVYGFKKIPAVLFSYFKLRNSNLKLD